MMKTFLKNSCIVIPIFLTLLSSLSCEEEKVENEVLSGELIGFVQLWNSRFKREYDNSGVEVVLEGSDSLMVTTTNESGKYSFENLKGGLYNLVFNKNGYIENKIIGYQFVGGNKPASPGEINVNTIPEFHINHLSIEDISTSSRVLFLARIELSGIMPEEFMAYRYFVGNMPDVSSNHYIDTRLIETIPSNESAFHVYPEETDIPSGSELYLVVYPSNGISIPYVNSETGLEIYPNVHPDNVSEVVSITIP
jgi:hypothetical protein